MTTKDGYQQFMLNCNEMETRGHTVEREQTPLGWNSWDTARTRAKDRVK